MKYFLFALSVCLLTTLRAQKNNDYSPAEYKSGFCKAYYNKIYLEGTNSEANIRTLVTHLLPNLHDKRCSLKLNYINESPGGKHYSFTQLYNGIPVYQGTLKVNTDKKQTVQSIFDNTYDTRNWNLNTATSTKQTVVAIRPGTDEPVLAELTVLNGSQEILTSGEEIIFQRDLNVYFAAPDSTVRGNIFLPDPLTTAEKTYKGIYANNNDTNSQWLQDELKEVSFDAFFDGAKFTLQNPYVQILDFDTPQVKPVSSLVPEFLYNRSQSGFEDVNAFYHLNRYRNYVAGMGFNCANALVIVDTHASNGDDNSYYAPGRNPPELHFGTGGVDDAEDADVLIHEYGHYLSAHAAPGTNNGNERIALDEAFGDYNAASYSRSFNTFNDEWVFNWDGHNEYWNGRVVNSAKRYPEDLGSNVYRNAEIWSSVLFAINGDIGRSTTDSLIIQTHYSYEGQISMVDAAKLLINADTLLFNGAYFCPIYTRLFEHGLALYPSGTCGITGIEENNLPNMRFAQTGNSFAVMNEDATPYAVEVFTTLGERIANTNVIARNTFNYQNPAIATGLYIVNVRTESGNKAFKWLKTY